jgi:hypothetical protein
MTNPSHSAVGSEKMRFCPQKLLRKHQKHVLKQFLEPDLAEPPDSGNRAVLNGVGSGLAAELSRTLRHCWNRHDRCSFI